MNTVKTLITASALTLFSFAASAEPVSVTSDTLTSAEAKIAAKAQESGASGYTITSARTTDNVIMTAELHK
ncbi:TPA: DUF1471 domain-containing protein [Morganella morganii]|uniref:DUF1471 domain-containing protein n=1 Tax=Morganella TaxID=581 RepID=UPI0003F8C8D0|nr:MULTISPECIES: DUF1471 domain-containing protein [Morganella]ELA7678406.1 DUF1471 domain-containing protein [Morganella morganii]ETO44623.1 hypothetical protein X965_01230 [Morganella sp. EGD-HP17]KJY06281.1 hypothetical protein Mm0Y_00127 [Morganella morganii]MBT0359182.1 DUF1471 domain-containing protein [Morganella morganii subsp. morganii]MDU2630270.1 DUF1471 domain-containing protein [Morganella morganii]